jgi:hypothetical protein
MAADGSNNGGGGPSGGELVAPTRVTSNDGGADLRHLADNRGLIVRRALLATAVGGVIPIPVLDEYFAGRVRAGMLMKIAERRQVDLAPSSAELLGDPREGNTVRNATLTAVTLLALKKAWGKLFTVLAIGRRAEEMATTFQLGMLFDHFCAKLHVGAGLDRTRATELRAVIHGALAQSEREALVTAFREGGRVLGRSTLEAPTWVSERMERAARRWAETGGQTADPGDPGDLPLGGGGAADDQERRWLDRAAAAVESRLSRVEHNYLSGLVRTFEQRWRDFEARRRTESASAKAG